MTEVVAAYIRDGERFMICQRPAHKARGLLWEFAGGKVEPGETKEAALVRECREELAVTVAVGRVFMELDHHYPDLDVHLTLFYASITEGAPEKREHADIRFITAAEIPQYAFCPADETILAHITALSHAETEVREALFAAQDLGYRDFVAKLTPTVAPEAIIGVRTPAFRKIAKDFQKSPGAALFMERLPHRYYEENSLHAVLISTLSDYDETVRALEAFLPHVDNWATCDILSPKAFLKRPAELPAQLDRYLASAHPYTVRFGIGRLVSLYLDAPYFDEGALARVAAVRSEAYYVRMMQAWFFATALAKQYDRALSYLTSRRLEPWTHNKTIQKAIESYRITEEQKTLLRTLKIK